MAYLNEKISQLDKALRAWDEILKVSYNDITRDAAIQRFEFSYEQLWKTVKLYLKEVEEIECDSPKSCFREAKNLLDLKDNEVETCLKMTADRNLSVHTYSEEMAKKLYDSLREYCRVSRVVFAKIEESLKK